MSFYCKYCGEEFSNMRDLLNTAVQCSRNPKGAIFGHEPL